jgi:transmembrane sensor
MDTVHSYEDAALLRKVLTDEATDDERRQAEELLARHPELRKQFDELKQKQALDKAFGRYDHYSADDAYHRFMHRVMPSRRRHLSYIWYSAASVVLLAVAFAWWYAADRSSPVKGNEISVIEPGAKKGDLVLPDGNHISMSNNAVSTVCGGVKVIYHQGLLSYVPSQVSLTDTTRAGQPSVNRFVIPRGGENTILLSDGTKVHLNAASELDFPTEFTGSQRLVTLSGEAYFEVSKDADHPFIVRTHYGNVTVLGTSFNVKAYSDNNACYVTLVRGKVRFTRPSGETAELNPGQQVAVSEGTMHKRDVNVDDYVSWVSGLYNLNDESLGDIMYNFEKWYNIDVVYEDPSIRNLTYTGTVRRYGTMNSFLDVFQLTGDIRYRIQNRKVYLYKRE